MATSDSLTRISNERNLSLIETGMLEMLISEGVLCKSHASHIVDTEGVSGSGLVASLFVRQYVRTIIATNGMINKKSKNLRSGLSGGSIAKIKFLKWQKFLLGSLTQI